MLARDCFNIAKRTFSSKKELVICEKLGRVQLVGINRPDKKNCVNTETAKQLREAFEKFEDDPEVDAAVLYGKGGTFCAGFDLSEASTATTSYVDGFSNDNRPMGISSMVCRKPVIAAVQGYAVAGGLELACWADLRVMEDTAIMGVFCRRFGVPLIDGGTVRLPALIGLSRAMDLILTGRPVDAKEAFQIGLANRIVNCGTGLGQAVALANNIIKFPQECLKADKSSALYATYSSRDASDAMQYELNVGKKVLLEESVQGAKRFLSGVGRHGSFNLWKTQDEKAAK